MKTLPDGVMSQDTPWNEIHRLMLRPTAKPG